MVLAEGELVMKVTDKFGLEVVPMVMVKVLIGQKVRPEHLEADTLIRVGMSLCRYGNDEGKEHDCYRALARGLKALFRKVRFQELTCSNLEFKYYKELATCIGCYSDIRLKEVKEMNIELRDLLLCISEGLVVL